MDKNKRILLGAVSAAVVVGGVAIGLILSKTPKKADLSTIHTQSFADVEKETMETSTKAPAPTESTAGSTEAAASVTADIETYASGKVSIQYPVVRQLEDEEKQEKINAHIKANALSIIKANGIDEAKDALTVKCSVISIDRKRISITYIGTLEGDGAAHPANLFYTNTVNLLQNQDMGLDDFTDAYTMAGYVLSDDVKFSGISADVEAQVLEYRSSLDIDSLTAVFNGADFPLESDSQWPESFSYEKQGTIYFSMPVPHALGDYVIVSFDPSTK